MRNLDRVPSSVELQLINACGVYMSPSEKFAVVSIDKPVHSAGIFNPGE